MPDAMRDAAAPAAGAPTPPASAHNDDRAAVAPLVEFVTTVLRHRRLVLGFALPAALLAGLVSLSRTREYLSASSFIPQSRDRNSALSALASQYGVQVGSGDTQGSPAFYVDLLTSRAILEQIADTALGTGERGRRASLAELYDVDARTAALQREKAIKALAEHLDVSLVPRSGIIRVQVSSPDPTASRQINGLVLALANDFNLNTRRSQAKAERQFAEQRLERVRGDLRTAEDRLERFYSENRVYEGSPALTFAQTRITRDVELQRQLYATLTQQAEQAKLDEVRDTPVITVLEPPSVPLRPQPRGTVRLTLFALIGGGTLGVLLALLIDTMRRAAVGGPGELAGYRRSFAGELRRPWRLLRPARPHGPADDGAA